MAWTMAQAKYEYLVGSIDTFVITLKPDGPGWIIYISNGDKEGLLVDDIDKKPMTFKTLEDATEAIKSIESGAADMFVDLHTWR